MLQQPACPEPGFATTADLLRLHPDASTLPGSLLERAGWRRGNSTGEQRIRLDDLLRRR